MSEECFVFGAIVAWAMKENDCRSLDEFNALAIAKLHTNQDGPELLPSMFSFSKYGEKGSVRYREQIIHFGASYNGLTYDWHLFIEKFEALLKTMAWQEAHVFLHAELGGEYHYEWKSKGYDQNIMVGVSEWSFSGGPRTFEDCA